MKSKVGYIILGACIYGSLSLALGNHECLLRHLKRIKKCGCETVDKVKNIFK